MKVNTKKQKNFWVRVIREGTLQLWRNKFLSLTTIGLGILILFLLNFVFGIRHFIEINLQVLEARSDFSIPLEAEYDAFELNALTNELGMYSVETKILPAETFEGFSLSPRINVQFLDLSEVSEVLALFKKARYSDVVGEWDNDSERSFSLVVDKLLKLRNNTDKIAKTLVVLFVIGGVLLAINTFQLIIFSRREEIFIARLVGADNNFIMAPFLFEGVLLGIGSALLAIVVFILVLREMTTLPGGDIFVYLFNAVFGWQILIAGLVGALGAFIAVRRYLLSRFE